jgi:hypothetical protein
MRGRVCCLQLLLALASAVTIGSESHETRNHILLSQIRNFHFCRLLRLAGLRLRYLTRPTHSIVRNVVSLAFINVKVILRLTISQLVSLSVEPHVGHMIRYLLLFDRTVLFLRGALSDARTGLSFVYASGPRQRCLSRVRVPWDS